MHIRMSASGASCYLGYFAWAAGSWLLEPFKAFNLSWSPDDTLTVADLDTAASAMSNGSLDLDYMESKGQPVSGKLDQNRMVNWEAF